MHRLFAPLGRFLLAAVVSATFATLSSCSESDNRPLLVVHDPVTPVTSPANVGRVDVKVTTPNGNVDHSFTAEDIAKGDLGVYLPAGTSGTVTVVVVIYDKNGNVIATSQPLFVVVEPGKLQTTSVWPPPSDRDASTDTEQAVPDGPTPVLDAGIDGSRPTDVTALAEVGIDVGVVTVPDAPLIPDAPPPSDTLLLLDVAVDTEATGPDAAVDTTPVVPVWHVAENIEKDQLNKSYYPVVAVDSNSQDAYVAWTEGGGLKVKRFNYKAQSWEATKTLETRGDCVGLTLGVDGKGNVLAIWHQDSSSVTDETLWGIWATTSADGVAWSPPYHLVTGRVWDNYLAVARNGTARVAYSMRTTTNVDPLFHAYYDGLSWTNNATPIYDPQDPYGFNARLHVNESGDGYVLFNMNVPTHSRGVGVSILTGKSGASTPIALDDATATSGAYERDLAMNKKGTVVAVWSEYATSGSALRSKSYSPTSGWAGTASTIVSTGYVSSLVAALDDNDELTLAWQQKLANNKYNTLSIHGKLNGAWGEIIPLETDNTAGELSREDSAPQLAIDGSGNVLVTWRKEIDGPDSESADNKTYGIYGSAYRNGAWQTPVAIYQKTGISAQYPKLSVSDKGFGVVTFYAWASKVVDPDLYNAMVGFYR